MKKMYKLTTMVSALVVSCFGVMRTYQTYNHVDSNLLIENVEALSCNGEGYAGMAKDYETGTGLYIIRITGTVGANINVGMRIDNNLSAELKGQIEAERIAEWKLTCRQNMGCYTSCENEDWHSGEKDDKLVRGCD